MEQNSRLKPATKHDIRCAAALACPKMAPTFLIGQTLTHRAVDNALMLFRVWPMRFQRYFDRPPFLGNPRERCLVVVHGVARILLGRAFVYLLFQPTKYVANYGRIR